MTDVKINHVQFLEHYQMDIALDNGHRVSYGYRKTMIIYWEKMTKRGMAMS